MKKRFILIFAPAILATLIFTVVLVACSTLALQPSEDNGIYSDTVDLPTHLTPTETDDESSTESLSVSEEATSESESLTESEETTLASSESEVLSESEESSSEQETEIIEPSLEFTSYGNGTCAVSGIGNITDSYVVIPLRSPNGDVVTEIKEKAFYGNSQLRAVEIPSTVSHIGDMAFANCSALVYVSVDKSNKSFTDVGGILFSADMSKLVAYPSASGAASISLPVTLTHVSPMAFYGCNNLKTINYDGTLEQWSRVSIGELNYGLYSTAIICKDSAK